MTNGLDCEIIDRCDGLLQIVGQDHGPEPPTIDPAFGRVSYAQFEYRYADKQGQKTWVILTAPGFTENRNQNGAEQEELQQAYRERLQTTGQVWCEVADETELGWAIERLAEERASFRRPFRTWRTIGRRQAAALVLVAVICSVSWLAFRWQNDRAVARELASIDTRRIRSQLEKAIDDSYVRRGLQREATPRAVKKRERNWAMRTGGAARNGPTSLRSSISSRERSPPARLLPSSSRCLTFCRNEESTRLSPG